MQKSVVTFYITMLKGSECVLYEGNTQRAPISRKKEKE